MRKRDKPMIIRFNKFSRLNDTTKRHRHRLVLCLPWKDENKLKQDDETYEDQYKVVENDIMETMEKRESTVDIDYDELLNHVDDDQNDDIDDDQNNENQHKEESEYGIMIPEGLLDLNLDLENNGNNSVNASSASTATVTNLTLPNDEYYNMCTQLDERQQHLFNYVMQWLQNIIMLTEMMY